MNHTFIKFCTAFCLLGAGTAIAGDKEAMIASALSAAPASVADHATVKDHQGNILKQGDNGITCYPEMPSMAPMCKSDQQDQPMAGDREAMIASALSAAPAAVADHATVKDHQGNILQQGDNGITCYPEMPGMGPMCKSDEQD